MAPKIHAGTKKNPQRLEPVAGRLAAIVLFIHAVTVTFGRRFLAACHESQRVRAAAVIRRHQHLIDTARADVAKQPLENRSRPAARAAELKSFPVTKNSRSVACLPY
ncbi:MAG TPA: hypothetical protein VFW22_07230 [Pseudolabrys sp.]|nr:hypothetical protein [Pseudolabrys sp.]